jgi:muskelin
VPLAAHQPKYNFSVWYIGLLGIKDPHLVSQMAVDYSNHSESNATRLILKHLRTRGHFSAFESLLKSSKLGPPALLASSSTTDLSASQSIASGKNALGAAERRAPAVARPFEHPLITNLFDTLVKRGAWEEAEAWLEQAAFGSGRCSPSASTSGAPLFSEYLSRTLPKPTWEPIETQRTADGDDAPCGRGGHQMCLDSENGIAYLFGGWDGQRDLSDFWAYHINERRWRVISSDAKEQGGPGARSCHKMCYCPRTGFIYVLGRFVDQDRQLELAAQALSGAPVGESGSATSGNAGNGAARAASLLDALLSTGNSADVSGDNSAQGTPRSHSPNLGAAAPAEPPSSHPHALSNSLWEADFYRFSTRTGQWTLLSHDTAIEGGPRLIYDHQMLIDPDSQLLYVFGGRVIHPGNPNRVDLSGMYRYDVIQRKWAFMFDDSTLAHARIPSRVGHSMLIDTKPNGQRQLWIMSGQRGDHYLTDMWQYNPSTGRCSEVTRDYFAAGPHAGFTPRAALDSKAREIYYFTGLVQRRNSNERVRSSFWLYSMTTNSWSLIYEYGGVNSEVNKERTNTTTAPLALTEGAGNDLDAMDEDMPMESSAASVSSEEPTSFGFDSSSVNEDMSLSARRSLGLAMPHNWSLIRASRHSTCLVATLQT